MLVDNNFYENKIPFGNLGVQNMGEIFLLVVVFIFLLFSRYLCGKETEKCY